MRRWPFASFQSPALFQSTHPVWGATGLVDSIPTIIQFQSTHPVWGATVMIGNIELAEIISIHAPRVGCDRALEALGVFTKEFQSTHPVWGATSSFLTVLVRRNFNPRTPCGVRLHADWQGREGHGFQSTHPVWGATKPCVYHQSLLCHFNPRTPCGVRLVSGRESPLPLRFQSTHPVWGAT